MPAEFLYVIPNAHIDPVWLWRWRDGYSEAHNTIQSAVDRLRENPDLTFVCSSSSLYEWIEESNPGLFEEVKSLVAEGRFEIVGGWFVESDTIIASGESLIQQAVYGKSYFRKKFDKNVEIAYSVDSFGQNSGLPKILAYSGFKYYVMHRPDRSEKKLPNVFWWEANDGSRVLTLRTLPDYNTGGIVEKKRFFDRMALVAENGDRHQTFFMGVGNHGGGPTRQQIEWIRELQCEYNIRFSTLQNYFETVEKEDNLPTVKGELTHNAPGCYSVNSGIKRWISRCGLELSKAETLLALDNEKPTEADRRKIDSAWRNYLFNHFHDILPGSSIEAAYEDARDSLGGAADIACKIKIKQLHRMAKKVDTSNFKEGGVFVFNPLPWKRKGIIEVDTFMDPNNTGKDFCSLKAADGSNCHIQWNRAAVNYGPCLAKWGKLTAVVDLPALGYQSFSFEKTAPKTRFFEPHIPLKWLGKISFDVLGDTNDAWGHGCRGRLGQSVGAARLMKTETLEKGPVSSRVRAFYRYADSSVVLDLIHYADMDFTQADLHIEWREVNHALKMVIDTEIVDGFVASEQAYDIIERQPDSHEQPMRHWLAAVGKTGTVAIITDSTFAYDTFGTENLRLTLLRAVPYAAFTNFSHGDEGVIDLGRQFRRFWLTSRPATNYRAWLPRMSQETRYGVEYVMESNHYGSNPKSSGDRIVLKPDYLTMESCFRNDDAITFRCYNNSDKDVQTRLIFRQKSIEQSLKATGNSITTFEAKLRGE